MPPSVPYSLLRLLLLFLLAIAPGAAALAAPDEPPGQDKAVVEFMGQLARHGVKTEVMSRQLPMQLSGTKSVTLTPTGTALMIMVFVYPTPAEAHQNLPVVSERLKSLGDVILCRNLIVSLPWWGDGSDSMKADVLAAVKSFQEGSQAGPQGGGNAPGRRPAQPRR